MPIGDRILKRMERLRELRLEYGPLIKLLERNERLRKFMEKRPIIASLIEKIKPEILESQAILKVNSGKILSNRN